MKQKKEYNISIQKKHINMNDNNLLKYNSLDNFNISKLSPEKQ